MTSSPGGPPLAQRLSLRGLFRNSSRLAGGHVVQALCGVGQGLVLARALGPADLGRWGLVVAIGGTVGGFLSSATSIVLTRHLVHHRARDDRDGLALLLASTLALELLLGLLTALALVGMGTIGPYEGVPGEVYAVYGLTVLVMFPRKVWAAVCQDLRQFSALALVHSASGAVRLLLLLAGWGWGGLDLLRVAWLFVASQLLTSLWEGRMIGQAARTYGLSLRELPYGAVWRRRHELGPMWRFTGEMYVSTSAAAIFAQVDTLILGALRSATEVGYYRLGKSLFLGLTSVGTSVARVAYRDFNDLVAGRRHDELLRAARHLARTVLPLTLLGTLLVAAAAPWLLIKLYGLAYQPAVAPFVLQLFGAAACVGLSWAGYLLLALGEQRRYLAVQLIAGTSVVPLMFLGAWQAGASGMAVASSVLWIGHSVALLVAAVRRLRALAAGAPDEADEALGALDAELPVEP